MAAAAALVRGRRRRRHAARRARARGHRLSAGRRRRPLADGRDRGTAASCRSRCRCGAPSCRPASRLRGSRRRASPTRGWRTIFAVDAVPAGRRLIVAVVPMPRDWRRRRRRADAAGRRAARRRCRWPVAFFCFALLFLALAGLLPAWLVERRGLAGRDAGRIVAIATAFGIAGSLLAGWLMRARRSPGTAGRDRACWARRCSPRSAFTVRCRSRWPSRASRCRSRSAAWCRRRPSPRCRWSRADPRAIGPINGLLAQAGSLGSLAGPPLLALWVDWTGWALAPVLLLAVAVLGAACSARRPAA